MIEMTGGTFLFLALLAQLIILACDLFFEGKNVLEKTPIRLRSFFFLVWIIILFALIQIAGLAMIPPVSELLSGLAGIIPELDVSAQSERTFSPLGLCILGIVSFYVSGFWDYVVHRTMHHRLAFLVHEYHHLPNRLFLALPGLSVRPFVALSVFPSLACTLFTLLFCLSLLGYHDLQLLSLLYVVALAQAVILAMTHSAFFLRIGRLHRPLSVLAITTPQDHEIHHTVDIPGNFGNFTTLWDRVFSTYVDPTISANQGHQLGLSYDQDYLGTLTAGKFRFSKETREKYEIGRFCNLENDLAQDPKRAIL